MWENLNQNNVAWRQKMREAFFHLGKSMQKPGLNVDWVRHAIQGMARVSGWLDPQVPFVPSIRGNLAGVPYLKHEKTLTPTYQVVYLHGGAYLLGLSHVGPLYANLACRLAHTLDATIWMPDYRLAPEYPFPAAFDDAKAFFLELIRFLKASSPSVPIILMGDSAGGGLALALINELPAAQQPAACIVCSPWTDLALTGETLQTKAHIDPVINVTVMPYVRDLYLKGASPKDPKASPLYGTYSQSAPVLVVWGGREILYDDARRCVERLQQQGVPTESLEEPEMFHSYPVFAPYLPQSQVFLTRTKEFVAARTGSPTPL